MTRRDLISGVNKENLPVLIDRLTEGILSLYYGRGMESKYYDNLYDRSLNEKEFLRRLREIVISKKERVLN